MKHEINLDKYPLRTDLALEVLENSEIKKTYHEKNKKYQNVKVSDIFIDQEMSKVINKKIGRYITISFEDVTDHDNKKNVLRVFSKMFKTILPDIKKDDLVLIIGLGNHKSTPDALGPKSIDKITVTNHLYDMGLCEERYQRVATFKPGVIGETGIDTGIKIKSLVDKLNPKIIIAIDALASGSIEHVNKTIQITDTGIEPGSGIGNKCEEISFDKLKIPVIAIGIPTVVDAVNIVGDTINYMYKQFSFSKNNLHNAKYRFTYGNVNYLKDDIILDKNDKEMYFGLIGKLSEFELKKLIDEVLSPIGYNLMVTPKEIDFVIDILAEIISHGINDVFSNSY